MSRVGKKPVPIPSGVTVTIADGYVKVKGPKVELQHIVLTGTSVAIEGNEVKVSAEKISRNPAFGTMRAQIANMVTGVTTGFSKTLEIVGTGYRAEVKGKILNLLLGFSHQINYPIPEGVTVTIPGDSKGTLVILTGADKEKMGQTAAKIRGFRPPEPYGGKGVRFQGEKVREKAGKAASKGGK